MRKIMMIVAIVTMAASAQAQEKLTWGIRAGFGLVGISGDGSSSGGTIGYNIGAILDWNVAESFYIQPGLYYTKKGTIPTSLGYLEVPILASYRFDLGGKTKLHVNAGPYFAYGVVGDGFSGDYNQGDNGRTYDNSLSGSFHKSLDDLDKALDVHGLNRFDAGLAVGAGFTFNKFYLGLNYEFGLTNVDPGTGGKNTGFNIGIGYNFL